MDHSMEDNMNDLVIDSTEDLMDYSMDYNGTPEQRVASEDPVSNRTVRTSTRLVIVDLHEVKDGKADFDLNHLTLTASGKVTFIYHNVGIPRYFDDSVRWAVELPPTATRGNSTRLYIDLVIPTDSRTGPLGWYDEEPCRWLYGVQQLGWLGFVNLQELVLDLAAFGGDDSGVRDGQLCAGWQNMIADWVRDRVVAFGVAKRSIEIRINGVQWQKWDLPEALQEQASRPHFYRDRSLPYSRDDQCESPPPPRRASF
ncbi:hypothetical protein LTR48_004242 [Friedmanniomyces endolithicus]|nr:hypothetical protein LTR94_010829 [Friedmanniomyces endolithicus]KAK0812085.1 hypothetical protein LTR59_001561 [Friedmanniomyces endolithicus]KAK0847356.1 hypothetical protein LTR03_006333 [Friedmanniomyces endolithicus]KAK0936505.1 hypothetical protein LTR29_011909 [Friedmanniomyces endolithicus]KAK1085739.1 hypothetical protein LTR48_004242 [Friedmanniomyces endolithicus]